MPVACYRLLWGVFYTALTCILIKTGNFSALSEVRALLNIAKAKLEEKVSECEKNKNVSQLFILLSPAFIFIEKGLLRLTFF